MRGNPNDATGNRRRTTNGRRLFVDLHRGAVGHCGQTRTAASQHDHVDVVVPVGHGFIPSLSTPNVSLCSKNLENIAHKLTFDASLQPRIADNSLAALMTASLPPNTTSSR